MVKANGLSFNVEQLETGSATVATAVLIHGLGVGNLATWYFTLGAPLAHAGLRVIMYDLRGHGRSDRPPAGYQVDDHVDDLEALSARLAIPAPFYLLGNSFGGTIAFSYAARHPQQVAGLAAVESMPPTARWQQAVAAWQGDSGGPRSAQAIASEVFAMNVGPRAIQAAEQLMSETTLRQDMTSGEAMAEDQLKAIDCPVLCIYGSESVLAPHAAYVVGLLRNTDIVMLPGRRHKILLDDTAAVTTAVLAWLSSDCGLTLRSCPR
jgi:pimeloyl-ACP methyl ester carboxylesterase